MSIFKNLCEECRERVEKDQEETGKTFAVRIWANTLNSVKCKEITDSILNDIGGKFFDEKFDFIDSFLMTAALCRALSLLIEHLDKIAATNDKLLPTKEELKKGILLFLNKDFSGEVDKS